MTPPRKADRGHAGGNCGANPCRAVLDYETAVRRRRQMPRGIQKQVRRRLTACNHRRAEQTFAKVSQKIGQLQFVTDLLRAAARRNADGQWQPIEHFGNSRDRCKRLKPGCYHQSDTLGIRGGQRPTPLAFDDTEHFGIAHAAEALDEILLRYRIAADGQHVGMGLVDDRLAVDQHPIAVENHQLETAAHAAADRRCCRCLRRSLFSAAGTIRFHDIQARLGWSPRRDARLCYHAVGWEPEGLRLIAWRAKLKGNARRFFSPSGPARSPLTRRPRCRIADAVGRKTTWSGGSPAPPRQARSRRSVDPRLDAAPVRGRAPERLPLVLPESARGRLLPARRPWRGSVR